jgi:ubiquinone/menaquinone biosynthesis C-methylase UbiE
MSHPDPLSTTIATYDQCARSYVARNRRDAKTEMRRHFELFGQLVRPAALVVDIGCGPGLHSLELARRGFRTVSLDLSRGMLREAQTMGVSDLVLSDMRSLPLAPSCADGLWISASFLHVPRADASATLTELQRALKPGGVLCLVVKRGEGDVYRNNLGNLPRYFILWHEDELDTLLRGAGFRIVTGWTDSPESSTMGADWWITRFATKTG